MSSTPQHSYGHTAVGKTQEKSLCFVYFPNDHVFVLGTYGFEYFIWHLMTNGIQWLLLDTPWASSWRLQLGLRAQYLEFMCWNTPSCWFIFTFRSSTSCTWLYWMVSFTNQFQLCKIPSPYNTLRVWPKKPPQYACKNFDGCNSELRL